MRILELLPSPEELYDARLGDDVGESRSAADCIDLTLPYQQGDVFKGVDLPGVSSGEGRYAMLFMHPCTMRAEGGALRELVTVINVVVENERKVLSAQRWEKRYKVMPLPDLLGVGVGSHYADFMGIATVPSSALPRTARIAQLSRQGRLVMQQRIVHHLTRYSPHLDDLEMATAGVEVEAEAQADWVAAGARGGDVDLARVEYLEAEFQDFLGPVSDPESLRRRLGDGEGGRSEATRLLQREIARRYPRLPIES